jgi:vacuolar-type H+-ATPase subunit I/STV1
MAKTVKKDMTPIPKKRLGWRGGIVMVLAVMFLVGAVVMVFGVVSMQNRGVSGDDILAAMTMSGAFGVIGILLVFLALKARRVYYVDATGRRVAEDGSALPFVVMAQQLDGGVSEFSDDGYDGGDDGGE